MRLASREVMSAVKDRVHLERIAMADSYVALTGLEIEDRALRGWCDLVVVLLMQLAASSGAAPRGEPPSSLVGLLEAAMEEEVQLETEDPRALWERALGSEEARRLHEAALSPAVVCRWMLVGYDRPRVTRSAERTAALSALSGFVDDALKAEDQEMVARTLRRLGAVADLTSGERDSLLRVRGAIAPWMIDS
jgi:hypothetical protein